MIRNIIFDWCGTLINDLEAVWQATNQTFVKSGVAPLPLETFRKEFALPYQPFYQRYTPHVEPRQLEAWFFEAFANAQESVHPFAHSQDFLEFCRTQGIGTFVLSAIHPDHFEKHLALTQFDGFFDKTYVGVNDKREKIGELLSTHDLAPEETLFVGDMQHDIETAKHGRTRSCGVLTGFNTLEQLNAAEPDLVVEHLGELKRILLENEGDITGDISRSAKAQPRFPIPTVGALIYDDHDHVLMIQTLKWSNKWGIPGGKIEMGEAAEDALRREIQEETNLAIEDIQFVVVQDAIYPPEFYKREHFLLLNYTCRARQTDQARLNHEAHTFRWVSPKEALTMDLNRPTQILLECVQASRGKHPS